MLTFAFVCGWSFAQDYTGDELEALSMIREADLGIERVYSEDGRSYTYALPATVEAADHAFDGAFTWRYAGQAVFEADPGPVGAGWARVPDVVYTSMDIDPEAYFGVGTQSRVDEYGRTWVLDTVDVDAAYAAIEYYDKEVATHFEPEGSMRERTGIEYPENAGEWRYTQPTSWSSSDCDGGDTDILQNSYDGLGNVSPPLNERQQKIVLIWGQNGSCSGTMVSDKWVLTAAHCTANSTGPYPVSSFTVCLVENLQEGAMCFGVTDNRPFGGRFMGSTEMDVALLELSGFSWTGWFPLSDASDTYIDDWEQYHRAYPAFYTNCANNTITSDAQTVVDSSFGREMHSSDGTVQSTPSGYIKYNISSAVGMSGGPNIP